MNETTTDGRVLRAKALRRERRAQILQAGLTVFAEKGYEQGSIADIIETANIARGTFYAHFESKRAVFAEILDDLMDQLNDVIVRVEVDSNVSAYDQLVTIVVHVLDVLIENLEIPRILLRGVGPGDVEFQQKIDEFYDRVLALIRESLETGVELAILRDVDVEVFACCVLGSMKEAIDTLILKRDAEELDRRALAEKLIDYILNGVLKGARRPLTGV